jgi:hypothetical protein
MHYPFMIGVTDRCFDPLHGERRAVIFSKWFLTAKHVSHLCYEDWPVNHV